jgi:GntR family transcriptional regulator
MPIAAPMFEAIAPEAAGMPLYRVVKRSLLQAIASGLLPPGAMLPSEAEIAARMGVSIGTLRRAVDDLTAEHILVRRQGRGTFVATHNTDRSLFQFFRVEREDGLREAPATALLSFARRTADEALAQALQLRAGDGICQIEQCLRLQGHAVVYDRVCLPGALFTTLTEAQLRAQPGHLYQLYQAHFGITVLRSRERARARGADRDAANVLGLAIGDPVLQVHSTALTFGDRPVEHRISTINTTHHDYACDVSRHGAEDD